MRKLLRPVAVVAAGTIMATGLQTPVQAVPADDAAVWLDTQLTDGLVHNDQYDFDDLGLSADVALGLGALGDTATVGEIVAALAPRVDEWTTYEDDVYAGSVAKAVVVAQTAGQDPRDFGGVDLVQRLQRRVADKGVIEGRIRDKAAVDYSNTIGQAFAALGLARAESPKAGPALRFLLKQQCSQGFYRLGFARIGADKQGCDAGGDKLSVADTDVTALAVLQLDALPRKSKRVRASIADAKAWLKRAQRVNGSFGGGPSTDRPNANSTGLAAWALGETGVCAPASRAAEWVAGLQVSGDVTGTPLEGEVGAIAYNRAAYTAGESDGITVESRDQWRRTSSQAAPGLRFVAGC
jgi:hypothetical protein